MSRGRSVTYVRPGRLTFGTKQIEQMAVEAQTADRDKAELQGKLKAHKGTLARYKSDLVRLDDSVSRGNERSPLPHPVRICAAQKTLSNGADRDDLLSTPGHVALDMEEEGADSPALSQTAAQRSRLLSATDKLADGQRRLEESHRVALQTEDVGSTILRDLRGQRDVLEHTRDTVSWRKSRVASDFGCFALTRCPPPPPASFHSCMTPTAQ